ncbi:unnamed protein product [Mycena citricolor]|uniref:Nucleolar protein 12 n=1 Tax=Mycena citricolor TaxID=2018698 RepID=A0AAD2JWS3_9AGAR|nr:unnamed protein product [Mycena citricolor]CAK5281944.1 unnamed protein product [Mycena citricolor]
MSLSFLLSSSNKIDTELDSLFKSNTTTPSRKPGVAISVPKPGSAPPSTKKRKLETGIPAENHGKRVKADKRAKPSKTETLPEITGKGKDIRKPHSSSAASKSKGKRRAETEVMDVDEEAEAGADESDPDEDNSDLENAYIQRQDKRLKPKGAEDNDDSAEEDEEDADEEQGSEDDGEDSDSDSNAPPPQHESITNPKRREREKPTKKVKLVPKDETRKERDSRTLFVGGLPIDVVSKKPLQKQLSHHLLSFLPPGSKVSVESLRFRSVAFKERTSSAKPTQSTSASDAPNHAQARISAWRKDNGKEGDDEKQFLTPAQKKKIFFIQGAFHPEAQSVNGYVVLAHHKASFAAYGETDEAKTTEDTPYKVAAQIALAANLKPFLERDLRVDVCSKLDAADGSSTATGDPKRSIFVGNLEFGSKESDLREFFEGVVAGERGPASEEDGSWVQGVRLIRDPETQLGKGFGYVWFSDRECVDEILSLGKTDEGTKKLRFAKRALRVQRCRTIGGTNKAAAPSSGSSSAKTKSTYPVHHGDPNLGERIVHLDKEARKAAKKADPQRTQRRAEKKLRMGMNSKLKAEKGKVGGRPQGKDDKGKHRERVRKPQKQAGKAKRGAK